MRESSSADVEDSLTFDSHPTHLLRSLSGESLGCKIYSLMQIILREISRAYKLISHELSVSLYSLSQRESGMVAGSGDATASPY